SSYALVPAVGLALLIGWLRSDRRVRRSRGLLFALVAAVCALPVLGWIELARSQGIAPVNAVGKVTATSGGGPVPGRPFSVRRVVSYVWQFYLPRLPWLTPDRVTQQLSVYRIWLQEGWGLFGWLEVPLPGLIYPLLAGFTSLVAIASAAIVATFRDRL